MVLYIHIKTRCFILLRTGVMNPKNCPDNCRFSVPVSNDHHPTLGKFQCLVGYLIWLRTTRMAMDANLHSKVILEVSSGQKKCERKKSRNH
jgi:hypothetical protein